MTEADLAARLHRDLSALATEAEWSVTATTGQAYGSYTDPIADAKTEIGVSGDLDDATDAQQIAVRQAALRVCLDRLELHFTTYTDLRVGERDEKLSQIRTALAAARLALSVAGGIARGLTIRRGPQIDYTTHDGDETDA